MLAQAHANCPAERRDALLWWRARLYAHYGFFEESAAMLTALRGRATPVGRGHPVARQRQMAAVDSLIADG
jgi:hypothetical protein